MTDQSAPRLGNHPDIAAEIGFLVMETANFEVWLATIIGTLIGNDEAAMAILRNIDNVSAKIAIMFDIARRTPDAPHSSAVLEHEKAVTAAFAMRNNLCHSLYGFRDGKLELVKGVTSVRRGNIRGEPIDAPSIKKHSDALAAARTTMLGDSTLTVKAAAPQTGASRGKRAQSNPRLERHPPDHKDPPHPPPPKS